MPEESVDLTRRADIKAILVRSRGAFQVDCDYLHYGLLFFVMNDCISNIGECFTTFKIQFICQTVVQSLMKIVRTFPCWTKIFKNRCFSIVFRKRSGNLVDGLPPV